MSYVKPVSVLVLSLVAGLCASSRAEEPAPKGGTRIIILDGKRVRVDEKMNVVERLDKDDAPAATPAEPAKKEAVKEVKAEDSKETAKAEKEKAKKAEKEKKMAEKEKQDAEKSAAKKEDKKEEPKKDDKKAEAAPAAPAAAPAVAAEPAPLTPEQEAEAKEKAARATREAAQALSEEDMKMHAAVKKLAGPGWRDAQVELIHSGKAAVPYLIEAMGDGSANSIPAAYNLGGHTKADAGRATRQRTVQEVATEVLTEMVTNHSNFKGELPTVDQRAWQTWWTLNGGTVTFGK